MRDKLLAMRQEIFQHLRQLEDGWQGLAEPDIEFEEEAQKAELAELYAHLDDRQKEELGEIDRALSKFSSLSYGRCESCSRPIPLPRLTALPATRFCHACGVRAEGKKKIPPARP
ncbi:TraR/DksA family transcriptional regulator [Thiovibrio sp. JS02]